MKSKSNTELTKSVVLTTKQKTALDLMINGKNVFLTGPAGTGKTTILTLFKQLIPTRNIAITSMTGISAILLGGITMHSFFGIGLGTGTFDEIFLKISKNPKARAKWKYTDTVVIDEISMLSAQLFEKLDMIGRNIRGLNIPFGGLQLILCGDFLQLPVINNPSFCFESKIWKESIDETVYLNEIVRQTNSEFQNILNNIRYGIVSKEVKEFLDSRRVENLNDIKSDIKPTRLYTTNKDVNELNENELYKLDTGDGKNEFLEYNINIHFYVPQRNEKNYFDNFIKNCSMPQQLILCIGAQVMLLKNIDVENGLANGSRGVVTKFENDLPCVKFMNGNETIIDYADWEIEEGNQKIAKITQIPLRLAWSLTVHKAQSCTLDNVEVDLSNIFEYGQAYVALSRVRNKEGLRILNIDYTGVKAHPKALQYYKNLEKNKKIENQKET